MAHRKLKLILVFALAYIGFFSFNMIFSGGRIAYDTARNEKIITEFARYGTFTYFDVPFIVSPPLYYIIHSFPVGIFGAGQGVFKTTEITLYFLGALIAFFIVKEFRLSDRAGLLAFFLLLIDGQMFGIQAIDFWGIILLFSSLLILFFVSIWKKGGILNYLGFGVSVGLGMLSKSSFIFIIIPLVLTFLAFSLARKDFKRIGWLAFSILVGVALYSPWMYYLTSNGFPIITNPEAQNKLPWDPDFKGYSYQDIYKNAWIDYWPIIYPFSIAVGGFLIFQHIKAAKFEEKIRKVKKLKYFLYRYRELGVILIGLLVVVITLPFFNRLLVGIPVGEQFLSIALASYLVIVIAFFKANDRRVKYIIIGILVVNSAWTAATIKPAFYWEEHQLTCGLYTNFFSSLGSDKAVIVDEKISRIAYPAHNVLYKSFFEWFSYNENYDISRILTMNMDYVVVIDSERVPGYLKSGFFALEGNYTCKDFTGREDYKVLVYSVRDLDGIARSAGLGRKAVLSIESYGMPVQAAIFVSGDGGFAIEYKSKRDGRVNIYLPGSGNFTANIVRTGFKTKTIPLNTEGGETLINLERDSPLITHTTANRY